jgi:hypothetical protein
MNEILEQTDVITKLITPALATELLTKLIINRPLNKYKVNKYKSDMLNNQWIEKTGETIKFDSKGNLIDGQHRLNALILANISINFLISLNCDEDAQKVIDMGNRSVNDSFKILGIQYYDNVVTIVKGLIGFYSNSSKINLPSGFSLKGQGSQSTTEINTKYTVLDMHKYYYENEEKITFVIQNFRGLIYSKYKNKTLAPGFYLKFAALLHFEGASFEYIYNFLEQMLLGLNGSSALHPSIYYVRELLIENYKSNKPAFKNVLIYELIIKAWNNYITNKQNKTIKLNNEIPHILIK